MEKIRYSCKFCSKCFLTSSYLEKHVTTAHANEGVRCSFCLKWFVTMFEVVKHEKEHHKAFLCTICKLAFQTERSLKRHLLEHEPSNEENVSIKVEDIAQNGLQVKEEVAKPDHRCSICSCYFDSEDILKKHIVNCVETLEEYRSLSLTKCSICSKVLEAGKMKYHRRLHLEKIHQCDHCGKTFSQNHQLIFHIKAVHNKEFVHACEICGKSLSTKKSLDTHKRMIHEKDKIEIQWYCEKCGKGFHFKSQLAAHLTSAHSDKPSYLNCSVSGCLKKFKSNSALKDHLPTHQQKKLEFPCHICSKILHHPISLKRHLWVHQNGPRSFTCPICNKSVTHLKFHIRTHTGEKPFSCEHCDKSFISKGLLRTHSVVHTKERPHMCKSCGKGFTQRGPLKAHFRKTHPQESL